MIGRKSLSQPLSFSLKVALLSPFAARFCVKLEDGFCEGFSGNVWPGVSDNERVGLFPTSDFGDQAKLEREETGSPRKTDCQTPITVEGLG
jgi:hypothetical protein